MNIGENIKKVRKLKGMSQKELSDLSGVPRVSISRYENNERTPTIDIVKKLSDALYINLEILVNWTDILNVEPNVIDFLDELERQDIDSSCCNNFKMCCGEGVCGSCTARFSGHRVKRFCKIQASPRSIFEGRRLI